MESKLLSSPVSDIPAEPVRPEQQTCPGADALAEVCQVILADCRLAPAEYLKEIRVAASGE
jgi:hypothetical protein